MAEAYVCAPERLVSITTFVTIIMFHSHISDKVNLPQLFVMHPDDCMVAGWMTMMMVH